MKPIGLAVFAVTLMLAAVLLSCDGASSAESAAPDRPRERRSVGGDSTEAIGESAGGVADRSDLSLSDVDDSLARVAPTSDTRPQERLRVYAADLDLGVASTLQARDAIAEIAQDAGGYVEVSSDEYIVIRVPADSFKDVLASVESIGTIRSRSVRTDDVTDQFFDLARRLEIATAARDRLNVLLSRTSDADERVAILREIRRLTEEIEKLRASYDSLAHRIAYSRITVHLTARIAESAANLRQIPFPWIARLNPLGQSTGNASFRIPVDVPESFAVFKDARYVAAEAADGTTLRIGSVANNPAGDEQFWSRALEYHLGPAYARATRFGEGLFHGVVFQSMDRQPYHYAVAVAVIADEILVVEVFYPDTEALETRRSEIAGMLREVEL